MKTTRVSAISVLVLVVGLPAGVANADFTFGEPVNLGPTVNSSSRDSNPSISADGLSLYFGSSRPGTSGNSDIWVATRSALNAPWGKPVNLGPPVNSGAIDIEPDISADGLELYFEAWGGRMGNVNNNADVWVAKRATMTDLWEPPVNLVPLVSTTYPDGEPSISFDGLELYFVTGSFGGDSDLFVSTRATSSDDWGAPVQLSQVNPPGTEWSPSISPDGRVLLFGVSPEGSQSPSSADIWMTIRDTVSGDWNPPVKLESPINSTYRECPGDISADGRTLYFDSQRAGGVGGTDIWQAPIIPIVDLNSDGIVDAADMCIMVDHWGTDNKLCDIGPMAWGDGIVNTEDLEVLAEHLFEEVDDPTLIAHWPLDEVQGVIAYNDTSDCDGTLVNGPIWQPDGGIVAGALQLDGIDDYVSTDFVLNPAAGPFSVIVWIKGGIPGQVVLSQAGGASWLCMDSIEGNLMTELKGFSRSVGVLPSQTAITDGSWHRIGLVWDGSHRHLYVDGVEVAKDSEPLSNLMNAPFGLYFGAVSALTPGTFFSGLIDDIRIYNRAVHP